MTPEVASTSINIRQVPGSPASGAIDCGGTRVDTGQPYAYDFSKIEPVPPVDEFSPWTVSYDAEWMGPGKRSQ